MPTISPLERGWASGVLYAMFPLRDDETTFTEDFELHVTISRFFTGIPFKAALGLRAALLLIVLAPLFLIGQFAFFPSLAASDRMRVLERLLKNRSYAVRQLVMAWKAVGGLVVVGHESSRRAREHAHAHAHESALPTKRTPAEAHSPFPAQGPGHVRVHVHVHEPHLQGASHAKPFHSM